MAKQVDPSVEQAMSEWQDKQTAGKPIQIIQAGGVAPDSSDVVVKRAAPASSIQGSGYTPGQMYSTIVGTSQTEQMADMLSAIAQGVQTGIQFVDMSRREQYRKNEELFRKDENTANSIILGEVKQYKVGDQVFDIPENATELDRQKAAFQFMNGMNYDWETTGWMQSKRQNYLLNLGRSIDVDERQLSANQKTDETTYAQTMEFYIQSILDEGPSTAAGQQRVFSETKVPGMGKTTFGELFNQTKIKAAQGESLSPFEKVAFEIGTGLTRGVRKETEENLVDGVVADLRLFATNFYTVVDNIYRGGDFQSSLDVMELPSWQRNDVEGLLEDPSVPNLQAMMFRMATSDKDGNPISLPEEVVRNIKTKISMLVSENDSEAIINRANEMNRRREAAIAQARASAHIEAGEYPEAIITSLGSVETKNIPIAFNDFLESALLSGDRKILTGLSDALSYGGLLQQSETSNKLLRLLSRDQRFAHYIKRASDNSYVIDPNNKEEWNALIAKVMSNTPSLRARSDEGTRRIISNTAAKLTRGDLPSTQAASDNQVREFAKLAGISTDRVMELFSSVARTKLAELGIDPDEREIDLNGLVKIGSAFLFPVAWGDPVNSEFFNDSPIDFEEFPVNINNVDTASIADALFLESLSAVRTMDIEGGRSSSTIPGTGIPINSPIGRLYTTLNSGREPNLSDIRRTTTDLIQVFRQSERDPSAGEKVAINPEVFADVLERAKIPRNVIDAVLPEMIELHALAQAKDTVAEIIKRQDEERNLPPGVTPLSSIVNLPTNPEYFIDPSGYRIGERFLRDELSGEFNVRFDPNTGKLDEESNIRIARRLVNVQRTMSRALDPNDPNWKSSPAGIQRIEEAQEVIDTMFTMATKLVDMDPNNENFGGHQVYVFAMLDTIQTMADDPDSNLYGLSSPERLRMFSGAENNQFAALLYASTNPRTTLPIIARTHAAISEAGSSVSSRVSVLAAMSATGATSSYIAQGASLGTFITQPRRSDALAPTSSYIVGEIGDVINTTVNEDDVAASLERIVVAPMAKALNIEDINNVVIGLDEENNPIKWSDLDADEKITYGLTLLPKVSGRGGRVSEESVRLTLSAFNQVFKEKPDFARQFFGDSPSERIDSYFRSVVAVAAPGLTESNLIHHRLSPSGVSDAVPSKTKVGTQTILRMQHNGINYREMPIARTERGTYSGAWLSRDMPRQDLERTNIERVDGATFIWNATVNPSVREALLGGIRQSYQLSGRSENQQAMKEFSDYLNQGNIALGNAVEKMAELGLHPQSAVVREAINKQNSVRPDGSWRLNKSVRGLHPLLLNLNPLRQNELPTLTLGGVVLLTVTDGMFGDGEIPEAYGDTLKTPWLPF